MPRGALTPSSRATSLSPTRICATIFVVFAFYDITPVQALPRITRQLRCLFLSLIFFDVMTHTRVTVERFDDAAFNTPLAIFRKT